VLDYLREFSFLQWALIVAGFILLVWPYIIKGVKRSIPSVSRRSTFDDVILLRQTIADDEAAVKAIDELIVPAIVKRLSE
jgi:hypothetical protein